MNLAFKVKFLCSNNFTLNFYFKKSKRKHSYCIILINALHTHKSGALEQSFSSEIIFRLHKKDGKTKGKTIGKCLQMFISIFIGVLLCLAIEEDNKEISKHKDK